MRRTTAAVAAGIVAVALNSIASPVAAGGDHRGCAEKFDRAQRMDMESFRDFDAATFRAVHDPAAISIFPTGEMFVGIDEIMAGLNRHFTKRDAVWSWTELNRRVDGCKSAVIVYDASYDIPAFKFHQRAITVVTYVYKSGRWLGVMDQGTLLELTEG